MTAGAPCQCNTAEPPCLAYRATRSVGRYVALFCETCGHVRACHAPEEEEDI